jgi:hypothetical protein
MSSQPDHEKKNQQDDVSDIFNVYVLALTSIGWLQPPNGTSKFENWRARMLWTNCAQNFNL